MAKELTLTDNYVIYEDTVTGAKGEYAKNKCVYREESDKFIIKESIDNGTLNILKSEVIAGTWTDGVTPFNEATLRTYLQANTGFNPAAGSSAALGEADQTLTDNVRKVIYKGNLSTDAIEFRRSSGNGYNFRFQAGNTATLVVGDTVNNAGLVASRGRGASTNYTHQFQAQHTGSSFGNKAGIIWIGGTRRGFWGQYNVNGTSYSRMEFWAGLNNAREYHVGTHECGNADKRGHWLFRTQLHLGAAQRAPIPALGEHSFVQEIGAVKPTVNRTNGVIAYVNNINAVDGTASKHYRNENGDIIKLFAQNNSIAGAAFAGNLGNSVTDADTFGGFTIGQIAQALINNGLLK